MGMRWLTGVLILCLTSSSFVVFPAESKANEKVSITKSHQLVKATNGQYTISYDLQTGIGDIAFNENKMVTQFHSDIKVAGLDQRYASTDTAKRKATWKKIEEDKYGSNGQLLTISNELDKGPTIIQNFYLYPDNSYLMTEIEVQSKNPLTVEIMEPISASKLDIGEGSDKRIFTTPYSNNFDFGVAPVHNFGNSQNETDRVYGANEPWGPFNGVSHWVTAVFDQGNNRGIVAGAATTKNWKSSQKLIQAPAPNAPLDGFSLYNWGGSQIGKDIVSDKFFLGYFNDYRTGLETFGKVYEKGEPRLKWEGNVPVGYNTWYSHYYDYLTADAMYPLVDYVAENLKQKGYQYFNLDAGWEKADGDWTADPKKWPVRVPGEDPMKSFANYIHAKGLKAGIYFNPFSVQESYLDNPIPNTTFKFRDTVLKDAAGTLIKTYIGTYALDPTHPGAQTYIRDTIQRYVDWGYDYVKIDFLDVGMQEGAHYDASQNGIQAYRTGLGIIRDTILAAGRPIFIDESIAPLLPGGFAHGRRSGCDTTIGVQNYSGFERQAFNTQASWFSNGTIYSYNDPDMIMPENFANGFWYKYSQADGKLLATTVAMGGGSWLAGDNVPFLTEERYGILRNSGLLDLVQKGKAAKPVKMSNFYHLDEHAPAVTYLDDGEGTRYVGMNNWSDAPAEISVSFHDLGLQEGKTYAVEDVYDGITLGTFKDKFTKHFDVKDSTILKISSETGVTPTPLPKNLALGQTVTVSTYGDNSGSAVVDGNPHTSWSPNALNDQWVEINFATETTLNQVVIKELRNNTTFGIANYSLQYWDGSAYVNLTKGYTVGDWKTINFPDITTSKIRLSILSANRLPVIGEIEAYHNNATNTERLRIDQDNSTAPFSKYSDIRSNTQRMQVFDITKSDIPKMDIYLYESYVNQVPKDNLYMDIVQLNDQYIPVKTLFSASLPPYNIPGNLTPYSIYPRLSKLDTNAHYAFILRSPNSVDDGSINNKYGFGYHDSDPYSKGFERLSNDGGLTWVTENGGKRDLMFNIYQ
ncbi:discoidin domain-containing protein [Paenibacillus sp. GCM10027628]|uniref:discoidin domain-containing protein n=1 Tax=Paenibacillus sp. GCM10027628 TaxID=3273413 RepID=UPI003624F6ED